MTRMLPLSAAAAVFALQAGAFAQPATVTTDLALRVGPGLTYPVLDVIDPDAVVEVAGCVDRGLWCQVSWNGRSGWVYSAFLARERPQPLRSGPAQMRLPDRQAPPRAEQWASVGPRDAAPPGPATEIVVGPPLHVETYVMTHRVEPVHLQGEAVVDATLPGSVRLHPVPGYRYRYAYVNDRIVLADPETYRIVHVFE